RIAEVQLQTREDGKYVLASVANGDGGEFGFWVRTPAGEWQKIAGFKESVIKAHFAAAGEESLDLISRRQAPRGRVAMVPLDHPEVINMETLILPGTEVIQDLLRTRDNLLVLDLAGGVSQIRTFAGREPTGTVRIPPVSTVEQM